VVGGGRTYKTLALCRKITYCGSKEKETGKVDWGRKTGGEIKGGENFKGLGPKTGLVLGGKKKEKQTLPRKRLGQCFTPASQKIRRLQKGRRRGGVEKIRKRDLTTKIITYAHKPILTLTHIPSNEPRVPELERSEETDHPCTKKQLKKNGNSAIRVRGKDQNGLWWGPPNYASPTKIGGPGSNWRCT